MSDMNADMFVLAVFSLFLSLGQGKLRVLLTINHILITTVNIVLKKYRFLKSYYVFKKLISAGLGYLYNKNNTIHECNVQYVIIFYT